MSADDVQWQNSGDGGQELGFVGWEPDDTKWSILPADPKFIEVEGAIPEGQFRRIFLW